MAVTDVQNSIMNVVVDSTLRHLADSAKSCKPKSRYEVKESFLDTLGKHRDGYKGMDDAIRKFTGTANEIIGDMGVSDPVGRLHDYVIRPLDEIFSRTPKDMRFIVYTTMANLPTTLDYGSRGWSVKSLRRLQLSNAIRSLSNDYENLRLHIALARREGLLGEYLQRGSAPMRAVNDLMRNKVCAEAMETLAQAYPDGRHKEIALTAIDEMVRIECEQPTEVSEYFANKLIKAAGTKGFSRVRITDKELLETAANDHSIGGFRHSSRIRNCLRGRLCLAEAVEQGLDNKELAFCGTLVANSPPVIFSVAPPLARMLCRQANRNARYLMLAKDFCNYAVNSRDYYFLDGLEQTPIEVKREIIALLDMNHRYNLCDRPTLTARLKNIGASRAQDKKDAFQLEWRRLEEIALSSPTLNWQSNGTAGKPL